MGTLGSIKAFKKAARKDLMGDLGFTQSQLDAISSNLLTTGKGLARSLTVDQARQVAAIQRISARGAKKVAGIVQRTAETATSRYGTAMGGIVHTDLLAAAGTAKAAKSIGLGAVRQAKGLAQAGQAALAIQQSSTKEAIAGAEYAMATALKSRGQADATQVAQMQFQLEMQKQAQDAARAEFKFETDYLAKQGGETGVLAVAQTAAMAWNGLRAYFNPVDKDGNPTGDVVTAQEAAQLYIQAAGIADVNQQQVIFAVANAMWANGAGPSQPGQLYGPGHSAAERAGILRSAITTSLISMYPHFQKYSDRIDALINAWMGVVATGEASNALAGAINGEPSNGTSSGIASTINPAGPGVGSFLLNLATPFTAVPRAALAWLLERPGLELTEKQKKALADAIIEQQQLQA